MALLFNGTSNSAIHGITSFIANVDSTIACTFKTGGVVTGVTQYPMHINRSSSFLRGWGIEINSVGAIRLFRGTGSIAYSASLGTAVANTTYRVVITRTGAGVAVAYLNTIGNTGTLTQAISDTMSRIITGALYDNTYLNYFGGKVARVAYYNVILGTPDITTLLTDGSTPSDTTVTPQSYWIAVANDTATVGGVSTVRTGTTYDADTLTSAPSYAISSTNSGANDLNAGAVNTASVTGYVVGVNPVVSGTVGTLALTSVSQATTIATFTIPAPVNDSYYPQPDTSHTLTLTDGSNPATFNAVMNSLAGYTSIVAVSPDLADPHKIPYWLTSTAVNDDRIMYKTADMTVSADGGISGATLGVTTIYYHWRVADSKIYAYEALLSEDGIAISTPKSCFIGLGIGIGFGI